MPIVSGIISGIQSGIRSGLDAFPPAVGVTRDGPNGWYVPQSAGDFAAILVESPDYYGLCGEAAGDLVPEIDALAVGNLVVNATGHLYQQAVSGWTKPFVGFDGLVNSQRWGTSAAALNVAAGESYAMLVYASFTQPAATRRLMTIQGAANEVQVLSTGRLRTLHNSVTADSASVHSGLGTVRQILWYRDARAGVDASGLLTDLERTVGTHSEGAVSGAVKAIGSNAGAVPAPASRFGLYGIWKGAKAEAFLGSDLGATALARLRGA